MKKTFAKLSRIIGRDIESARWLQFQDLAHRKHAPRLPGQAFEALLQYRQEVLLPQALFRIRPDGWFGDPVTVLRKEPLKQVRVAVVAVGSRRQ